MDNAYYEDLAGRLYGLVIRLSDRMPADRAGWVHHVTEVGEYGLALEDMWLGRFRRWIGCRGRESARGRSGCPLPPRRAR